MEPMYDGHGAGVKQTVKEAFREVFGALLNTWETFEFDKEYIISEERLL